MNPDPRFLQVARNIAAHPEQYDEMAERLDSFPQEERVFVITELSKFDDPAAIDLYEALIWRYSE